jgi:membrane protein implicated in regulation of membrane protease activity
VLYAYVALAIVGFVLLGASLLGAGHDAGHDVAVGHDGLSTDHASPASALLSVRVWTYLLAFGGVTGVLLRLVGHEGEPTSALGALAVGIAAAVLARVVIGRASRAGASGTVQSRELVGRTGDVIVPFAAGKTGKIRVRVAGGDLDVLATADDGEALEQHDEVLIVELREGGTALVTRNPASK